MRRLEPGRKYISELEVKAFDEVLGKKFKVHQLFLLSDLLLICRERVSKRETGLHSQCSSLPAAVRGPEAGCVRGEGVCREK
jgi:hypothetical protein